MPKKDWLRDYIVTGRKAYILGFTPPPASVYREVTDDLKDVDVDGMHRVESRMVLLRHGIDVKSIVSTFLNKLKQDHGSKRSNRMLEWIETGVVNAYSYRQRQELYADRKRLKRAIYAKKAITKS